MKKNDEIRVFYEGIVGKVSDTKWSQVRKILKVYHEYSINGIKEYMKLNEQLKIFNSNPDSESLIEKIWIKKSGDNIRGEYFLDEVSRVFPEIKIQKPKGNTIYKWFSKSKLSFSKDYVYQKKQLIEVVIRAVKYSLK